MYSFHMGICAWPELSQFCPSVHNESAKVGTVQNPTYINHTYSLWLQSKAQLLMRQQQWGLNGSSVA